MTDRHTEYEERIAHLERNVQDLSDILAGQAKLIDRLSAQARYLLEKQAERESDGAEIVGDERPPHW